MSTGVTGKCINCGLVNWPGSEFCKRCGLEIGATTEFDSSQEPGSTQGGSNIFRNFKVFLAGLVGCIVFFVSAVAGSHIAIPLAIAFACLGILFGYLYSKQRWQTAIWLSLPYLLLITWIIISTLRYNAKWEGVFWRTEIFYGTIYLNFVPVIATFLGVLIGSTRSLVISIVLVGVIGLAFGWERYMSANSHFSISRNGSLEISNEDTRLKVDINCGYTKFYDYRGLRYSGTGGCGDSRISVLSKNPTYSLPTKATWVIDGKEIPTGMWPINGPNDSSTINRFDDHAYDDVSRWRATIPITSIMTANRVEFRWGETTIQLQSEELETLKNLQKEFDQLYRDL